MIVGSKEFKFVSFEKASSYPSEETLAKINQFALEPLTKEEVYCRSLLLCHNGIDLDVDRFHEKTLGKLRDTLVGKGFFLHGHPGGWFGNPAPGDGRFYEAHVNKISKVEFKELTGEDIKLPKSIEEVHVLNGKFYLPRLQSNEDDLKKMDAGVTPFVSIGFMAEYNQNVKDPDDPDDTGMRWNEFVPPAMALEGSNVWLGAQPGASIQRTKFFNIPLTIEAHKDEPVKFFWNNIEIPLIQSEGKEQGNDMKEIVAKLAEHDIIVTEEELVADIVEIVKGYEAIIEERTDRLDDCESKLAEYETNHATLVQEAEIGRNYKASLIDEIIRFEALLGDISNNPDDQDKERALLVSFPVEHLERQHTKLRDQVVKQFPPSVFLKREDSTKDLLRPISKTGKPDYSKPENNELFKVLRLN